MKYIAANKTAALNVGFRLQGHRHNDDSMILNEKEVMSNRLLPAGTLEEKAASLQGTIYTIHEIQTILKNYE